MTPEDFQKLLLSIPFLEMAQLEIVKARVDFLVGSKSPNPEKDWLVAGFQYELTRRGLNPVKDWQRHAPKDFAKRSAAVREFFLSKLGMAYTDSDKYALGRVLAEALIENMNSIGAPISLKVLLINIDNVQNAFDMSFPGYLQANLLPFMLLGYRDYGYRPWTKEANNE